MDTLSDSAFETPPPVAGVPARIYPVILFGGNACCDWLPAGVGTEDDDDGDGWIAAPIVVCDRESADAMAASLAERGIAPRSVVSVPQTEGPARALTAAALLLIATDPEAAILVCNGAPPRGREAMLLDMARRHVAEVRGGAFLLFGPSRKGIGTDGAPVLVSARRFLQEIEVMAPEMLDACADAVALAVRERTVLHLAAPSYEAAPALSIPDALRSHGAGWTMIPLPRPETAGAGSACASTIERAFGRVSIPETEPDTGAAPVADETVRPWGTFRTIDRGNRFQVKQIVVKPGGRLSLQMHHHRSEHWVVVAGTARIVCGDKERLLYENEHAFIRRGQVHRLENPGKVALRVIEVQSGSYLGEDDIVRFDDIYGRVPS